MADSRNDSFNNLMMSIQRNLNEMELIQINLLPAEDKNKEPLKKLAESLQNKFKNLFEILAEEQSTLDAVGFREHISEIDGLIQAIAALIPDGAAASAGYNRIKNHLIFIADNFERMNEIIEIETQSKVKEIVAELKLDDFDLPDELEDSEQKQHQRYNEFYDLIDAIEDATHFAELHTAIQNLREFREKIKNDFSKEAKIFKAEIYRILANPVLQKANKPEYPTSAWLVDSQLVDPKTEQMQQMQMLGTLFAQIFYSEDFYQFLNSADLFGRRKVPNTGIALIDKEIIGKFLTEKNDNHFVKIDKDFLEKIFTAIKEAREVKNEEKMTEADIAKLKSKPYDHRRNEFYAILCVMRNELRDDKMTVPAPERFLELAEKYLIPAAIVHQPGTKESTAEMRRNAARENCLTAIQAMRDQLKELQTIQRAQPF